MTEIEIIRVVVAASVHICQTFPFRELLIFDITHNQFYKLIMSYSTPGKARKAYHASLTQ